ncbi:putative candidate secreted effector protein [Blumeria hordei DH14]|uniref:Putative candidate secreted effector protein n=1 Tax=Blumeria graminis f. sp. hordei (strain DH14) TaxID=546991 RepID=N1JG93_BLUG1|nr:putative candidate secreted effector protein [Blumeria hordei DH14]
MRLLPLASFIALMSHLISVSAEYKYVCPSKIKFTTARIDMLRNDISSGSITEGVLIITSSGLRVLTYIFDRKIIDGVAYDFMVTVNYRDKLTRVYEKESEHTRICELIFVLD